MHSETQEERYQTECYEEKKVNQFQKDNMVVFFIN